MSFEKTSGKPTFATNQDGEKVADAVNSFLERLLDFKKPPEVAIASAYFNPEGFNLVADQLEKLDNVRILLGAEPQQPEKRIRSIENSANPLRAKEVELKQALEHHYHDFEIDRNLLGFNIEADQSAKRLVEWLNSGKVQVRRLEDRFLHGKAFIATGEEGVIAGSSNFTYAGLATNIELNLGTYEPETVDKVTEWFNGLWEVADDFDLASIYGARYEEHLPYLIYLKMLWERYGAELDTEETSRGRSQLKLTQFQKDGLQRARGILEKHHGVLIADEVGLGKSFLAGELIREAVEERRQRVLVVAPATLRDGMWAKFLAKFQLGVESVSYEDLLWDSQVGEKGSDKKGITDKLKFNISEYSMIIVDESHNLRNPSTQRANAIRKLLLGSPPKDLVLLTATPVNNSLWDLYYLLNYFIKNDGAFADTGIGSLRDHFAEAMAMNPDDLSPEHLFDILDAIAVRRTRSFIKEYYKNDTIEIDGVQTPIIFPKPYVVKVSYDLSESIPGFFDQFATALEGASDSAGSENVLTLARYTTSTYRLDGEKPDGFELTMAGLLRSGLLKRFESSAHAFAETCKRMASAHESFLQILKSGHVSNGEALADWVASDSDEIDRTDFYEDHLVDDLDLATKFDVQALTRDVSTDLKLLTHFAEVADTVTAKTDPKLKALRNELIQICEEAENEGVTAAEKRDKKKVLIFSYYKDTVDWIYDYLNDLLENDEELKGYKGRMTMVSGADDNTHSTVYGFAPISTEAPGGSDNDRYDILITTDVLAEGVNLQQSRHIINYDLPWNPMRLVQRHGRIDRIGSEHKEVFMRCIFPDAQLDELLGLEERLNRKIAQAASSIGTSEILPGSKEKDTNFSDTREEIERLRQEDNTLFEKGGYGRGVLSGEEFRQEAKLNVKENPQIMNEIQHLSWGSGSGMIKSLSSQSGFVFCIRIADHPRPIFRFIDVTNPAEHIVVEDTLTCLDIAKPSKGYDTQRVLSPESQMLAFDAWKTASKSALDTWNRLSDPANLTPATPAAFRQAAELVKVHKPAVIPKDEAEQLIDILEAPYPERYSREVRIILRSDLPDVEKVSLLSEFVEKHALVKPEPPQPLPEITEEDVHLVCWLAVVPE